MSSLCDLHEKSTHMFQKVFVLLAGAVGAMVPAALRQDVSRGQRLTMTFVGFAVATFLAPAINGHWLPGADAQMQAGVSFGVGLFGMAAVGIALRAIERRGDALADRAIDRVASNGSSPNGDGQ